VKPALGFDVHARSLNPAADLAAKNQRGEKGLVVQIVAFGNRHDRRHHVRRRVRIARRIGLRRPDHRAFQRGGACGIGSNWRPLQRRLDPLSKYRAGDAR
jgi:hypothetical protein